MITIRIYYVDGNTTVKQFKTKKDADWYCHMEGDHVRHWEYIK